VDGFRLRSELPLSCLLPTIRVTTHLVLIDAVVTDKQGNPTAGLHPEDFVVEENGKAQKIAAFTGPVQSAFGPATLAPGIYSNRPQYRSPGGPITVMLLDAVSKIQASKSESWKLHSCSVIV